MPGGAYDMSTRTHIHDERKQEEKKKKTEPKDKKKTNPRRTTHVGHKAQKRKEKKLALILKNFSMPMSAPNPASVTT